MARGHPNGEAITDHKEQRRPLSDENRQSQGELFLHRKWQEYNDIKRRIWAKFSGWHVRDSVWRLHKESSLEAGQGSLTIWETDFYDPNEGVQLEQKGNK